MGVSRNVSRIRQGFSDFRNGLSIIFSKPKEGEGDRKLAKMAVFVEAQIGAVGKDAVRKQVVKSIESDLIRAAKKDKKAVDALMQTAFNTPEYMRMLHKLGLEESHVRVMAVEALRNAK